MASFAVGLTDSAMRLFSIALVMLARCREEPHELYILHSLTLHFSGSTIGTSRSVGLHGEMLAMLEKHVKHVGSEASRTAYVSHILHCSMSGTLQTRTFVSRRRLLFIIVPDCGVVGITHVIRDGDVSRVGGQGNTAERVIIPSTAKHGYRSA